MKNKIKALLALALLAPITACSSLSTSMVLPGISGEIQVRTDGSYGDKTSIYGSVYGYDKYDDLAENPFTLRLFYEDELVQTMPALRVGYNYFSFKDLTVEEIYTLELSYSLGEEEVVVATNNFISGSKFYTHPSIRPTAFTNSIMFRVIAGTLPNIIEHKINLYREYSSDIYKTFSIPTDVTTNIGVSFDGLMSGTLYRYEHVYSYVEGNTVKEVVGYRSQIATLSNDLNVVYNKDNAKVLLEKKTYGSGLDFNFGYDLSFLVGNKYANHTIYGDFITMFRDDQGYFYVYNRCQDCYSTDPQLLIFDTELQLISEVQLTEYVANINASDSELVTYRANSGLISIVSKAGAATFGIITLDSNYELVKSERYFSYNSASVTAKIDSENGIYYRATMSGRIYTSSGSTSKDTVIKVTTYNFETGEQNIVDTRIEKSYESFQGISNLQVLANGFVKFRLHTKVQTVLELIVDSNGTIVSEVEYS